MKQDFIIALPHLKCFQKHILLYCLFNTGKFVTRPSCFPAWNHTVRHLPAWALRGPVHSGCCRFFFTFWAKAKTTPLFLWSCSTNLKYMNTIVHCIDSPVLWKDNIPSGEITLMSNSSTLLSGNVLLSYFNFCLLWCEQHRGNPASESIVQQAIIPRESIWMKFKWVT